ncbi:hypothetical protein EJB05_34542, partial [Eragrostis curvula]
MMESMEEESASAASQQCPPPPFSWFLCLSLCLFVAASVMIFKNNKKKLAAAPAPQRPPSPPGRGSSWWWCVLETMAFVADNSSGRGFYHFVQTRHRRYGGPCFRTSLFGHTHVFVSSPDAARALLLSGDGDSSSFSKRYVRTVAELLGSHSLLCASHARHRSLRRALAPLFFNPHATASLTATFDALTRSLIQSWSSSSQPSSTVVVLDAALGITFEAIVRGMLVGTLSDDKLRRMQSDVLAVTQAMLAFPLRMPGTRFHAGLQARERIMDVLRQEIASRRRVDINKTDRCNDFLHSLLRIGSLSDDQILDNILTLIIAGQVTTATAITWMLKYLADNTHLQESLRSVQLELAPKHRDSPLTLQQLNGMDSAYKVGGERILKDGHYCFLVSKGRTPGLPGFHIKKGWIVNVDARSLHYDPTIYENPTMFDPSRFDEETKANSFLAFGAGGRTCLGMNLAKMMMLIFLHRFVTTFRWEMADDDPSLEKWAMFPRLKNGCPLHLTPI